MSQYRELLVQHGQEQVLRFYEELTEEQKKSLDAEIAQLDFGAIEEAMKHETKTDEDRLEMIPTLTIDQIKEREEEFKAAGNEALKQGKVDGIMLDKPNFNSVARTDKSLSCITVPAYSVEIGFGFQKNDGGYSLQAQMNAFLAKLKSEGKTDELIDKWYGETEPEETIPLDQLAGGITGIDEHGTFCAPADGLNAQLTGTTKKIQNLCAGQIKLQNAEKSLFYTICSRTGLHSLRCF